LKINNGGGVFVFGPNHRKLLSKENVIVKTDWGKFWCHIKKNFAKEREGKKNCTETYNPGATQTTGEREKKDLRSNSRCQVLGSLATKKGRGN